MNMNMNIAFCPLNKAQNYSGWQETQKTICQLCQLFYNRGWINATGGGIAVRQKNLIFIAPVKENHDSACPSEVSVLDVQQDLKNDEELEVLGHQSLLVLPILHRGAKTVLHTHSMNSMLATWLFENEFPLTSLAARKSFRGFGPSQKLTIPIVSNNEEPKDLINSFKEAMEKAGDFQAVLIQGHGIYIWGEEWMEVQKKLVGYEYLLEDVVNFKRENI